MPTLPYGWRWIRRDHWYMELQRDGAVRAAVHLAPDKTRPYSLAYTDIGSWKMGGRSHRTRMAAIRACERWAIDFEREQSLGGTEGSAG